MLTDWVGLVDALVGGMNHVIQWPAGAIFPRRRFLTL